LLAALLKERLQLRHAKLCKVLQRLLPLLIVCRLTQSYSRQALRESQISVYCDRGRDGKVTSSKAVVLRTAKRME
jgi:hypothetical protein